MLAYDFVALFVVVASAVFIFFIILVSFFFFYSDNFSYAANLHKEK